MQAGIYLIRTRLHHLFHLAVIRSQVGQMMNCQRLENGSSLRYQESKLIFKILKNLLMYMIYATLFNELFMAGEK